MNDSTIRFPIGVKLALVIGSLVLVSLLSVTLLNSYFISQDVRITAEDNNLTINTRSANTVQNELQRVQSNALQLLVSLRLLDDRQRTERAAIITSFFFSRNTDMAAVYVLSPFTSGNNPSIETVIENDAFLRADSAFRSHTTALLAAQVEAVTRAHNGETVSLNVSPFFGRELLALLLPYRENEVVRVCLLLFSIDTLSNILGTGTTNTTVMINRDGTVLCHPESEQILSAASFKNHPLVRYAIASDAISVGSHQILFSLDTGERYLGAYQRIAASDIFVFTAVPLSIVLEGVHATLRNNLYLTAVVLFIAIICILCFARFAISRHLKLLSACAQEIQKGNFNSELIPLLNVRRSDEIGVLNQSTKDEQEFLNTFARFTNRAVAKAIARKEIDFEPHLKDVTVFFSDIRGFTAISDGFKQQFGDDSPREIIGFLNDYMSRMVNCITITGGTIDKFEGDAIMAVWGILRDDTPDSEQHRAHVQSDALSAIRSTIAMRYALMCYNKDAATYTASHKNDTHASYKPHISIGCGINTGRATCGIMGSEYKMEYTAIGDSVNFASRTESSNKPCGTDILITEDTYNLLKTDYIRCEENNFTLQPDYAADELIIEQIPVAFDVKGKGEQHFYAVVNMPQLDLESFFRTTDPDFVLDEACARCAGLNGPKTLAEVRSLLGIQPPAYESIDLHEEENKIQIKQ